MTTARKTIHASAVCVGENAVLIRGPSGSGKSRLAFDLMLAGRARQIPATRLIGDDRIELAGSESALIAKAVPTLAGLIEIRGLGIRRCDYVAQGVVGLVVDLGATDAARLPEPDAFEIRISGHTVSRIPIGTGFAALPLVIASLIMAPMAPPDNVPRDCPQEMINHIRSTLASP